MMLHKGLAGGNLAYKGEDKQTAIDLKSLLLYHMFWTCGLL